jgi:L-ascorbate 6-phosphate lactonase
MVHSFSTPILYKAPSGKTEIIVPGSYQMTSYDLATGSLIWRIRGLTYQVKSGPVLDGERLYFNGWAPGGEPSERLELPSFEAAVKEHDKNGDGKLSKEEVPKSWLPGNWEMQDLDKDGLLNGKDWQYYSFRRTSTNSAMAVQLGGRGDVTNSHVLWKYDRSLPDVPGILLYRDVLYLIRNGGILQTLDPKTGKLLKQGRLTHALDEYYTSPVAGDGKVYMISRTGTVSVLKAGADWELVSFAELGEEVFATPAIADGNIWVRTATALYAFAQQQKSASILEQIRAHREGIGVWWVGNAGWLIKANDVLIGTDLDLSTQNKVQPPVITPEELAGELDLAFVSHHHGDHCNLPTIRALAAGSRTTLVLPQTCLKRVGQTSLAKERLIVPEPGRAFEAKGIRVEPIHAIHGNQEFTVLTREPDFVDSIRSNCGYVLNVGGKRFLHPGDSVLTEEHLGLKNIDVLFVSPTVHNMYVDRSMILINRLQPAYIFPQHFGTFTQTDENAFWTRGYPDELKLRLSTDLQKRYHKLAQGEKFVVR